MGSDHENAEELHARRVLEAAGLAVTRLPTDDLNPSADYRATGLGFSCLSEVKGREISEFFQDLALEARRSGVAFGHRAMDETSPVARILRDAAKQVIATRERTSPDDFGLLWIVCLHGDAPFQLEQCFRRLYGFASINVFDERAVLLRASKPCFYYGFNSFFQLPSIEGVVLASRTKTTLCVNTFSPRYATFAASPLARLSTWDAVIDPLQAERSDEALVIDRAVDRKDGHALWRAIKEKYGVLNSPMLEFQELGMAIGVIDE